MKKTLFTVGILILLTACGYKPSAHYASKVIGEKIYTQVDVSLSDPENAVLTKDALNKALRIRLKKIVTTKEQAESSIRVVYEKITFVPIQYDKQGYVVHYQACITLGFTFTRGEKSETRHIIGRYEFPIRASAIISTDLRFKAIEKGSIKALDEFISYISAKGLLNHVQ